MNIIETLEKEQLRSDIPDFAPGDTVRVHAKIVEGSRERIQMFEGVVISRQGTGVRETFTVRRISYGIGVEQSSSICADSPAKLLVSKKNANLRTVGTALAVPICL